MQKLTDLKVFEDACKIVGLDAEQVNKLIAEWMKMILVIPDLTDVSVEAYVRITVVIRAANQLANNGKPWVPNWKDPNQARHTPYFEMGGSSGFRLYAFGYWGSHSYVGSRLCFISEEVAEYVGTQFLYLYEQLMVISEKAALSVDEDKLINFKKDIYKEIRMLEKKGLSNLTQEDLLIMTLLERNKSVVE